jgi:hypothetical protein
MTTEPTIAAEQKRFTRAPGLYDRFDLGLMLDEHVDFYIEKAGEDDEGEPLYALYEGVFICKDCRDQGKRAHEGDASPPGGA